MDYQAMWEELKEEIEKDLEYYANGTMCSTIESIHGALNCEIMLKKIKTLEEKYKV